MRANRLLIDIESLGFDEKKSSITEIGWLFVDPDYKPITGDALYIYPQKGKDLDPEVVAKASAVNGYALDIWEERGAMELEEAQSRLAEVMAAYGTDDENDRHLVWACNAPFDRRWTMLHFPFMDRIIHSWNCSMPVFRKVCNDTGVKVVAGTINLAGQCKIAGSEYRSAHGGIEDCYNLAGALRWAKAQGRIE